MISHEAGMRAQAKKMNVESLKQTDANAESAEMKIAKVSNLYTNYLYPSNYKNGSLVDCTV